MTYIHPQVQLVLPGCADEDTVGVDEGLAPLVSVLWAAGFTTVGCCQDLGESIGEVSPRKAAYWKGWVLLELPAGDAKRLAETAAAHSFPMHWADEGAWDMSAPMVMLGARAVLMDTIVQVHFPASQLHALKSLVQTMVRPRA